MIVEVDGERFDVPDDATPEEIDSLTRKAPRVGMGDVQASPSSFAGTGNVPVGLLTGDPVQDQQIAQNLAAQGQRHDITRKDVAGAAGVLAAMALPSVTALPAVLTGAASGAALGGLTSRANDSAGIAHDATVGGVSGATLPLAMSLAGRSARWLAPKMYDKAIGWGRKVLTGGATPLSAKKPISPAAVEEAYQSGAIRTGGSTAGTAERLEQHASDLGEKYGQVVQELEGSGVKGFDVRPVAAELRQRAAELERNDVNSAAADTYRELATHLEGGTIKGHHGMEIQVPSKVVRGAGEAPQVVGVSRQVTAAGPEGVLESSVLPRTYPGTNRPAPAPPGQVNEWRPAITEGTPDEWRTTLTQGENIKRAAQGKAKYSKIQGDSIMEGARKDQATVLRQAVEQAIEDQASVAPEAAARFVPIKRQLGAAIEGRDAARIAAARGTRLKHHSLTDEILKGAILAAEGPAGIPQALAAGELSRLGRMRGPSTWGRLAYDASGALNAIPQALESPAAAPASLTPLEALARRLAASARTPRFSPVPAAADEEGPPP